MKKTVIYLMRHGEVKNDKNILYGRLPGFHITERGRDFIRSQAKKLMNKNINFIYSSPMLRARETAGIIAGVLKKKVRYSKLLTEVKLIFDGIGLDEYKAKYQPFIYDNKFVKKGQESISDIRKRMIKFLSRLAKAHPGRKILVVSHGDPIVIVKAFCNECEFTWSYKRDNYLSVGTYIKIEIQGKMFTCR